MDHDPPIESNKLVHPITKPVVSLHDVNIAHGQEIVLKGVNLHLESGEFAYLIGKTGSGKSSLLRTLYADLDFNSGLAVVLNYRLNQIKEERIPYLRREMGIIFQDYQLLSDRNVKENLDFVLRATAWKNKTAMKTRIEEVLHLVNLQDMHFKKIFELSGGEQQRLVIARALLNRPKLLLADEPTGNLDPDTSDEIMNLFFKISKEYNMAVLMATHDYRIIDKFPAKVYQCVDAELRETNTSRAQL